MFVSFFYELLSFITVYVLFFTYVVLSYIYYSYKRFNKDNVVAKNPDLIKELEVDIPVDVFVVEEESGGAARYNFVTNRIEIHKDTIERFEAGEITRQALEAILFHELEHYEKRWLRSLYASFSKSIPMITFLFVIGIIDNVMIGALILAVFFKGFHFLESAIWKYEEKKADRRAYEEGPIKGLEDAYDYKSGGDKIEIEDDGTYEIYPSENERHIWITQFKNENTGV